MRPASIPLQQARRRTEYVRAAATARFENLDIESSPFFAEITDDEDAALAALASKTGIATEILRGHPNVLIGSVDAVVDVLQSRREDLGINYVTFQQRQAEAFAPIVARLSGL